MSWPGFHFPRESKPHEIAAARALRSKAIVFLYFIEVRTNQSGRASSIAQDVERTERLLLGMQNCVSAQSIVKGRFGYQELHVAL